MAQALNPTPARRTPAPVDTDGEADRPGRDRIPPRRPERQPREHPGTRDPRTAGRRDPERPGAADPEKPRGQDRDTPVLNGGRSANRPPRRERVPSSG